jgi:hypothetical protein
MSSTQRVVWTACPNGLAKNGKLRISVAIGPQLTLPAGATTGTLSQFPDWGDWAAARIGWQVKVGGTTVPATVVSAKPSSTLYTAMFHPLTPVNGHAYKSPTGSDLYTNSVATMRDHFSQLYTRLAGEVSPDGSFPTWDTLEGRFSAFPPDDDRLNALIGNLKQYFNPTGAPGGPINRKVRDTPSLAVPLNYKFLQPRVTAKATPRPPVLKPDFHQGYSLLQRHPALLRLFGFVVDLEVTLPSGLTGTVGVSVIPAWTPRLGAANTTSVTPVTMTDTATWLAAPRPASSPYPSAITGGLLPLDDPTQYAVVEMDTDGATLKSVNFVKSAFNAQSLRRSADTPNSYALTSLRSAGLSVAALGHAELVYGNWQSGDSINGQLTGSAATLYAEDIAQGYRIDVHDSRRGHWFQLCARSGDPKHLNGYGIGHPQHVVPVPAGDEGWVEPVTTQSPETPSGTPEVYLPETLFRWNGWSLVANRPGKHLSEDGSDSLQSDSGNPPPSGAAFQVQIDYAATPGTLPALRFTRGYRFRARVVDLAGNSLPFDKNAPFTHASPEFSYGRLEPLASPVIVPTAPRTAGESLETIVIRSNYNIPDAVVTPAQRHLAPPSVSIEMAEALGQFDDASGRTRTDLYGTLAARDGLSFSSPSVLKEFGGTVEDVDGQEWIWYPPGHGFAVPYLPDPLGAGTALAGLPGAGGNRVIVPFTGGWPARRSIRLVVKAGSGAPVPPPPGAQDGALTVHAPKASVTTALLSSWFEPGSLHFFQLWSWMTAAGVVLPAVQKLIEAGGHYMFTPYRALTIVHAVRQPLTAPVVNKITAGRNPGDTFALLSGEVHANPASSQRVDVLSSYTDPYDDGISAAGIVQLQHNARVFEIQPDPRDPAGIGFTAMRHDFGDTKHHFVYYSLLATSRFLEYFADTATVALHHVTPVEVSKAGFVAGTVVVTGTGANAKTHYSPGRDYTENDTVGTIARIAAGAIGDGAKVSVTYVAPPVTRSSLEKDAHPPTPKGFLVQIPSSQRSPAPDVRSVLPVFGWHKSSTSSTVTSTRAGSMLRVYLGRPWWASGAGEHLGVIVANPVLPGTALPPDIAPLVSGYGTDPLFATGARTANPLTLADFTLATATRQNVLLAEQAETTAWVSVAGHSVSWDPARKLWYADIALNISPSYFPFVQLALVRYQPSSLTGIEVSRVVVADMIQVAPDRTLQLTYPSSTVVSVTVSGPGFFDSDGTAPSTMTVYVQEATVKTSDPDLTWATVPGQLAGAVLKVTSETDAAFTWQGDVKLPAPRGSRKLRLLVSESENYPSVRTGTLTGRVSYLDAVEI